MCLTRGSDQEGGLRNTAEGLVNKRAATSELSSFDAPPDNPLHRLSVAFL